MSRYLSSILIDPIVRQARLFSRSSNNSEYLDVGIRQLAVNEPLSNHAAQVVAATTHEDRIHLVFEHVELSATVNEFATSSTNFNEEIDTTLLPWSITEETSPSPRHAETSRESYDRTTLVRSHNHQMDDDTSDNPRYGIPESFRSRDSSFSNSTMSGTETDVPSAEVSNQALELSRDRGAISHNDRVGGRSLPADDGKSFIRKKILAIQESQASSAEKARLVHEIMTEKYNLSQSNLRASRQVRAQSPCSILSQEHPNTPLSLQPTDDPMQIVSSPASYTAGLVNPFNLSPDDLATTYHSKPENPSGVRSVRNSGSSDSLDEQPVLGCPHYKRNVKLQCSDCEKWYTCRFCHDEAEEHSLNRRATKNMLCMLCGHAQTAGEQCQKCGEPAARYYCDLCKLWDDDPQKSIYHCNDCGICRVGQGLGKDFFHCAVCSVCVSMRVKESHRCIERSTKCDCPICGEYMFNSPEAVVFMPCGHSIHRRCYDEHMLTSYRCPICSRSVVNMDVQFRHLERAIESQPMPPQFQDTKVRVYCNDCSAKTTVKYHWLGLKCAVCDSFNTAQIQILQGPEVTIPPSRGRTPEIPRQSLRPAVSFSAVDLTRTLMYNVPSARNARSESPNTTNHFLSSSPSATSTSDPADSMGTDEEYDDDVEFWGGESPSSRARSLLPHSRTQRGETRRSDCQHHSHDDIYEEDDDGYDDDNDDEDDEDEDGSIDQGIEGDWETDSDGNADEEADPMDIFGHR